MTAPPPRPRWRAMEVGPGGLPVAQVGAVGPAAGRPGPAGAGRPAPGQPAPPGPSAVLGSFDGEPARSRRAVLGWLALAVAVAVVATMALWSSPASPVGSSADLGPGDCLTSGSAGTVRAVDCGSPDAEFTVEARFDNTADQDSCAQVSSDLVLATHEPSVLCLNYLVSVGDCLYAGTAADIGKAPCRTPGSTSTPTGLFRVIAVRAGTVDVRDCPSGTLESLVHLAEREVVCLGMP